MHIINSSNNNSNNNNSLGILNINDLQAQVLIRVFIVWIVEWIDMLRRQVDMERQIVKIHTNSINDGHPLELLEIATVEEAYIVCKE